jgi:hypothetical protein
MSAPAAAYDKDAADRTPDDTRDTNACGTQARSHAAEDPAEESATEQSDRSDAETPITVDATHAWRDRRGMIKSVLITIANDGTPLHSDRGDIGKATKRAEIIKAVRRKGLPVDEPALDQALIALAQKVDSTDSPAASRSATGQTESATSTPYFRESGALYLRTLEGSLQLTNFDATITADVLEDDGSGAPRRYCEITATVSGVTGDAFEVPDDEFAKMTWVSRHLGPSAVVYAGALVRDHARTAVQELSAKPIPQRHIYTHLGVRIVDGERVFLHAEGALSARGIVSGINVRLPEALARYTLPALPTRADLAAAVRASLGVLSVGPPHTMVPLLASAYRAPLGPAPFSPADARGLRETRQCLSWLAERTAGTENR